MNLEQIDTSTTAGKAEPPSEIWTVHESLGASFDGCAFDVKQEAVMHKLEWGGTVVRYIRADLAGEAK
jgi:hypothetical protein